MALHQLSNNLRQNPAANFWLYGALLVGLAAAPAQAQSLGEVVGGWWTQIQRYNDATPAAKKAPTPAKEVDPLAARKACEGKASDQNPPVINTEATVCARSREQLLERFPREMSLMDGFEGMYSDVLQDDYRDRLYDHQQRTKDPFRSDEVRIEAVQSQITIRNSGPSLQIQLQDFDDMAKLSRTEILDAELCRGPQGLYFRTKDWDIPVKFHGKRCLWIEYYGKWTTQRKFNDDFIGFNEPTVRKDSPGTPSPAQLLRSVPSPHRPSNGGRK